MKPFEHIRSLTVYIEVTGYWLLSREQLDKIYKELNTLHLLKHKDLAAIEIRLHTHWEGRTQLKVTSAKCLICLKSCDTLFTSYCILAARL
jgi:hypothetical protein